MRKLLVKFNSLKFKMWLRIWYRNPDKEWKPELFRWLVLTWWVARKDPLFKGQVAQLLEGCVHKTTPANTARVVYLLLADFDHIWRITHEDPGGKWIDMYLESFEAMRQERDMWMEKCQLNNS